jgi:hypothetical protein
MLIGRIYSISGFKRSILEAHPIEIRLETTDTVISVEGTELAKDRSGLRRVA